MQERQPNYRKPERPNWDSIGRGLSWVAFGWAIIGFSKVTDEESLTQIGATIATLEGGEFWIGVKKVTTKGISFTQLPPQRIHNFTTPSSNTFTSRLSQTRKYDLFLSLP